MVFGMSFSEKKFRDAVENILDSDDDRSEKLFKIMELFREAQYDMLSGISVSNNLEPEKVIQD
jgi:hypothetical protein